MLSVEAIVPALDRIDWNFPRSGTTLGSIHTLHRFPGNFIPQIPSFLIQALSEPGDIVLDPFGGSGTTAIEALEIGRQAIVSDRISACIFLAAAKVAAFLAPLNRKVKFDLLTRFTWDHLCESDAPGLKGEGTDPRLTKWYAPRTLAQLRYIWNVIEHVDGSVTGSLKLLFSDLLFSCASTRRSVTSTGGIRKHHWGWVADNVVPRALVEHNAIAAFRTRLFSLPERLSKGSSVDGQALVLQQDARALALPSGSVDLVVTSPPYIGVIDYVRANRLLYLWMGWPFDEEKGQEIGARFKRGRLRFVEEYQREMDESWREIHRVLRLGQYCALVIGESRRFRGTANQTLNSLSRMMPMVWGPVARVPTRRRISDRAVTEPIEYIRVFQKR